MQKFFSAERSTSKCLWRDSPPRSPRLCPWPALGRATAMSSTSSLDVRTSQSAVSLFSLGSNRMKGRVICSATCWLWTKYIVFQCSLVFHYVFEALPDAGLYFFVISLVEWAEILHSVFPAALFFSVQVSGDLLALAKPDPSAAFAPLPILGPSAVETTSVSMTAQHADPPQPAPANSIRVWLSCP